MDILGNSDRKLVDGVTSQPVCISSALLIYRRPDIPVGGSSGGVSVFFTKGEPICKTDVCIYFPDQS